MCHTYTHTRLEGFRGSEGFLGWLEVRVERAGEAAGRACQVLAIHLLHEVSKKEESFWYPYVCQLPRAHSTLAHFTPEEAAELQV